MLDMKMMTAFHFSITKKAKGAGLVVYAFSSILFEINEIEIGSLD